MYSIWLANLSVLKIIWALSKYNVLYVLYVLQSNCAEFLMYNCIYKLQVYIIGQWETLFPHDLYLFLLYGHHKISKCGLIQGKMMRQSLRKWWEHCWKKHWTWTSTNNIIHMYVTDNGIICAVVVFIFHKEI